RPEAPGPAFGEARVSRSESQPPRAGGVAAAGLSEGASDRREDGGGGGGAGGGAGLSPSMSGRGRGGSARALPPFAKAGSRRVGSPASAGRGDRLTGARA